MAGPGFAALAAAVFLVALGGARAERRRAHLEPVGLRAAAPAERVGAGGGGGIAEALGRRAATRRQLPVRAALAVLALAGHASAELDASSDIQGLFQEMDENSDGRISKDEYVNLLSQGGGDAREILSYSTLFAQADIDDDESLSMFEFDFARYLASEDTYAETWKGVSPPTLDAVAQMFDDLGRGAASRTSLQEVIKEFRVLLRTTLGRELDNDTHTRLIVLFQNADIIKDGSLNLNELEYFRFVLTESLMQAASVSTSLTNMDRQELNTYLVDGFLKNFDHNSDGKLDEGEVIEGLRRSFEAKAGVVADPEAKRREGESYTALARDFFASADEDGDGSLDRDETLTLVLLMTSVPMPRN